MLRVDAAFEDMADSLPAVSAGLFGPAISVAGVPRTCSPVNSWHVLGLAAVRPYVNLSGGWMGGTR